MVTKKVQIEFANSEWNIVDSYQDLKCAVQSASLNLFSKYNVRLEMPRVINGSQVVMDVKIPDEIAGDFSIGNHLRGLAAYLMKYCDGKYQNAVVGKRLLNYIDLPVSEDELEAKMVQQLSMISKFVELLKNNDKDSLEKINKISMILEE